MKEERSGISLKGSFGSAKIGKLGVNKENGMSKEEGKCEGETRETMRKREKSERENKQIVQ